MNEAKPEKRPRVAFISQGLGRIVPPHASGSIATWTYEVARRLSSDQPVMLLEFGERAFGTERAQHEGALYVYVPTAINRVINAVHRRLSGLLRWFWTAERRLRRPAYASIFHNLGFSLQAAWHARRCRCDVIHVHNFSQFVPVMRALNPNARIVLHMNCEWLSQHDPSMIGPRLARADAILGCSGHIARKIVERFPQFEARCQVVYNGTDVERFLPAGDSVVAHAPAPLRILFVGRISPEKGVHLLVDAFATVGDKFPTATLELVGGAGSLPADFLVALSDDPLVKGLESFYGGDYLTEIKRRVPERLKERVIFHGNVVHRDLAGHYGRATVFVNPSLSDAFPLTVVEAMAAGLPIVASEVGGVPESVAEEVTGLLVKPNSAEALAFGLCRLLGDSNLRTRMSAAARERALTLFSWQAIAGRAAQVYGRVGPRPAHADFRVDTARTDSQQAEGMARQSG
jgi:glycosyltransferase involved in cell wall biosynthesis